MRTNKRNAVFGKPASYYENPRMIARARRFRVGRHIRVCDEYAGLDWVSSQVRDKIGVITSVTDPWWDVVAYFPGTERKGGRFAFYRWHVEVVK